MTHAECGTDNQEILTMKNYVAIASLALVVAAPAAFAQDTEVQGSKDCASLQAQYDQAASAASAEQLSQAKVARDAGEKLCAEGKTAEGSAKLKEAISQIAAPTQQPRS
jgi:hypothetical protein